jgi:hypothetical protein
VGVVLFFVVIFGIAWVYAIVKRNAKRSVFFKGQYERQKALTHRNMVLVSAAPLSALQSSLAQHIPNDDSAKASFLGGAMRVRMEGPTRIVFNHLSHITTGGSGDSFTASVTFATVDARHVRAVVSIDRWREKDGVTRRAGLNAMEQFMNNVVNAFRAVDPAVQVDAA